MSSFINSLSRIFSRQAEGDDKEANQPQPSESSIKRALYNAEINDSQTHVYYHRPRSRTRKLSLNSSGIKNPLNRNSAPPPYRRTTSFSSIEPELKLSSLSSPICGGYFDTLSTPKPATCEFEKKSAIAKPRGRRNIMWEDSGYNTPSVKTLDDSLDEISSYNDASSIKYEDDDFPNRDAKGNSARSNSIRVVLSGEKFGPVGSFRGRHSSDKTVKYHYEGSDMLNSTTENFTARECLAELRDSIRQQSRSCSRSRERNSHNSRGMSPTFTDTIPVMMRGRSKSHERKSSPFPMTMSRNAADHHLLAESFVSGTGREKSLSRKTNTFYDLEPRKVERPHETDFLAGDCDRLKYPSASTTSLLSPSNQKFYLNTLEETKAMIIDENVNQILTDGSNEFNDKYSKWIQQVFHLQLDKIQSRLSQSYQTQLQRLNHEKENEVIEIKKTYRDKLLDLESSTEQFQAWFDSLTEENQHLKTKNEKLEFEMNLRTKNHERQFTDELDKHLNEVETKSEQEKLQLQKRHAEQIQSVTNKCNEQVKNLEDQYHHQIESLEKIIKELKDQNQSLSQHLELYKKVAGDQTTETCIKHPREREEMLCTINELREKLAILEKEKTLIMIAHSDEIVELHKELEGHNQQFNVQLKNSQVIISNLNRQREDDMAEMRERLQAKDKEYHKQLNSLRTKYGLKISELTETVVELQDRLIGRAKLINE